MLQWISTYKTFDGVTAKYMRPNNEHVATFQAEAVTAACKPISPQTAASAQQQSSTCLADSSAHEIEGCKTRLQGHHTALSPAEALGQRCGRTSMLCRQVLLRECSSAQHGPSAGNGPAMCGPSRGTADTSRSRTLRTSMVLQHAQLAVNGCHKHSRQHSCRDCQLVTGSASGHEHGVEPQCSSGRNERTSGLRLWLNGLAGCFTAAQLTAVQILRLHMLAGVTDCCSHAVFPVQRCSKTVIFIRTNGPV